MKIKSTNSNVAVGKKLGLENTAQPEYGYPIWAIVQSLTIQAGQFSTGEVIAQPLGKAELLYFFTFRPILRVVQLYPLIYCCDRFSLLSLPQWNSPIGHNEEL